MPKLTLDVASLTVQSFTAEPHLATFRGVLPGAASNTVVARTCCFSDCSCPNTQ